jgi:hypothetical protein
MSNLFALGYVVCVLGLAYELVRETPRVARRLRELESRPIAIRLNDLYPAFVAVVALLGFLVPSEVRIVILVVIAAALLPLRSRLLFHATGGRDVLPEIRRAWDDLERIAWSGDGGDRTRRSSRASRAARVLEIVGRLDGLRTRRTDELIELLAAQARYWTGPEGEWSRTDILREMRLFEIGTALWPNDPPWKSATSLEPQFLWELMDAYQDFLDAWASDSSPARKATRAELLASLQRFRSPETAAFLDLVGQIAERASGDHESDHAELARLKRASQAEMERIMPGIWVFRGAHARSRAEYP